MAPAKFLICGSFSTGKTTLALAVQDAVGGVPAGVHVRPEPARFSPLGTRGEQDIAGSLWLVGRIIQDEAQALAETGVRLILCDGGPPDIVAHTPDNVVASQAGAFAVLSALARTWSATYDAVFLAYPDPDTVPMADGFRFTGLESQRDIQRRIEEVMPPLNVTPILLPIDPEARVRLVLTHASQLAEPLP